MDLPVSKGNKNLKLLNEFEWFTDGQIADCCVHGKHSSLLKVKDLPATRNEPCFVGLLCESERHAATPNLKCVLKRILSVYLRSWVNSLSVVDFWKQEMVENIWIFSNVRYLFIRKYQYRECTGRPLSRSVTNIILRCRSTKHPKELSCMSTIRHCKSVCKWQSNLCNRISNSIN